MSKELSSRLVVQERQVKLPPDLVDQIINWDPEEHTGGATFEETYKKAMSYPRKFAIARALIESEEYPQKRKPALLKSFVSTEDKSPGPQAIQLKEKLQLLLGGFSDPSSKEAKEAEAVVSRLVDTDEMLKRLKGVLPIPVMGAITNALLFEEVSEKEKMQKLRSFTTRALIRPYLGDLEVYRPIGGELSFRDLVIDVPEKVFRDSDSATMEIVKHHFVSEAMKLFINSEEEGIGRLKQIIDQEQSETKAEFLGEILSDFEVIRDMDVPDIFVDTVEGWFTKESPLPLFRQKYFVHEFIKERRKLLRGETGATKTACAYLSMETAGAKRVTIIGPAKARNTWSSEAEKIFRSESQPVVFKIKSAKDLDDRRVKTAEYLYIGTEFLGRAWGDPKLHKKILAALVNDRGTDGIVFDESEELRNPQASKTRFVVEIVESVRKRYESKNVFPPLPMIAMTATPIVSSIKDLDLTLALLYPDRFSLPGKREDGKHAFSTQALRDPQIAHSLLFGEQLMIQWTLEDLFGEKAPKLEYDRQSISMRPYQNVLYEWVASLPLGSLEKIRHLRSVLLNPELLKRYPQMEDRLPKAVYSKDESIRLLVKLHDQWEYWIQHKNSAIPNEPFSQDWIAKFGERDLIIQSFFDPSLNGGLESLVQKHPEILEDWEMAREPTAIYSYLKKFLEARTLQDGASRSFKEKTFIVSPHRKEGVTKVQNNRRLRDENLVSLYEHMTSVWFPDLPPEAIVRVDGDMPFSERDKTARSWSEDGDKAAVVLASLESVYQSMDWAVRNTASNEDIKKVNVIFLGWPWGWKRFKQMSGRFLRPGQAKPIEFSVLETENSIDHGFFDLNRLKRLWDEITLAGVQPSREDHKFFRRSTTAKRIIDVQPSVGQVFLRDVVTKLQGRGGKEVVRQFERETRGKTFAELWTEFYYNEGKDRFRTVGNNAVLVKNIALSSKPRKMLSIGAGTCLFAREVIKAGYKADIVNIDINRSVLQMAKEKHPEIGETRVENASRLNEDSETFDVIDSSFMLPWSNLYNKDGGLENNPRNIERVEIILEMNRVLRHGGVSVLSFPESTFDPTIFNRFTETLESHFGFSISDPSGISFATDIQPKRRIGWVVTLQKIGSIDLSGLDAHNLAFLSDERTVISKYKRKKEIRPVVVNIEYPIFSSKNFEVYNPVTKETLLANSTETAKDSSSRDWVSELKYRLSSEQHDIWNTTRRRIEKRLNIRFKDAELVLAGILKKKELDTLEEWDEKELQRIVGREIRWRGKGKQN